MIENNHSDNNNSINQKSDQYGVILPCKPSDFGEFVSGLLGKPQTIEKSFHGVFKISRDDVTNAYHLVDQRIHQQNDATLVQFKVKILYDDNSSVLLNSLKDFIHYTEIRPIVSEGVSLSWTYLVRFKNKKVPEKQEIDISFSADNDDMERAVFEDGVIIRRAKWFQPSGVFLRISHTERTWGVDIESLLTGYVKTLMKSINRSGRFIYKNSQKIGFNAGYLFFISSIIGAFGTSSKFIESYLSKVEKIKAVSPAGTDLLSAKLDFLVEIISTGVWPRFILAIIAFVVISLVLAIFLGIWVGSKANNRPRSFVLLSKAAEKKSEEIANKRRRDWVMFGISVFTSIVTGIISNIFFMFYFGGID